MVAQLAEQQSPKLKVVGSIPTHGATFPREDPMNKGMVRPYRSASTATKNPVAKYAHKVNRAIAFEDRKKASRSLRKVKHRGRVQEALKNASEGLLGALVRRCGEP